MRIGKLPCFSVLFSALVGTACGGGDEELSIKSITPADGSTKVSVDVTPSIVLSTGIDPTTVTRQLVALLGNGESVPAKLSFGAPQTDTATRGATTEVPSKGAPAGALGKIHASSFPFSLFYC